MQSQHKLVTCVGLGATGQVRGFGMQELAIGELGQHQGPRHGHGHEGGGCDGAGLCGV